MKRIALLILAAIGCTALYGQNKMATYASFLRTPDQATGAQVIISNDSEISVGLRDSPATDKVSAFRVCIFFDSSQGARDAASAAEQSFKSKFPGIPSAISYHTPTFKVMVGNCLTKTEATILRGKVKDMFPQSTIVNEEIPLATFMQNPNMQTIEGGETTNQEVGEPAID